MSTPIPDPTPLPVPDELNRTPSPRRRRWVVLALAVIAALFGWRYRVIRPEYRLARGQDAIRNRDPESVREYADRLDGAGHADYARLLRGEALLASGSPSAALAEFNGIAAGGSIRLRAAAFAGRCLLALGEYREANRTFEFVLAEQPDNVDAVRGLAAIAYDLGQLGTAVGYLERVAELDPQDARPHRLIGLIYRDMSQLESAGAAYVESLARGLKGPEAGDVRREWADVLIQGAKFAEGLEVLDAGGPSVSESPDGAAARAECLRGLGRLDEAVELLDPAIERRPSAELYRLRGQIESDRGRPAGAVRHLERAAELAPADHRTRYLFAQALAAVGRTEDSAREFARVGELRKDLERITALTRRAMDEPWDAAVRLELADASDRLGKPKVAEVWRRAAAACKGRAPR